MKSLLEVLVLDPSFISCEPLSAKCFRLELINMREPAKATIPIFGVQGRDAEGLALMRAPGQDGTGGNLKRLEGHADEKEGPIWSCWGANSV